MVLLAFFRFYWAQNAFGHFQAVPERTPMKGSFSMAFLQFMWCLSVTAHLRNGRKITKEKWKGHLLYLCASAWQTLLWFLNTGNSFRIVVVFFAWNSLFSPLLPLPLAPHPSSLAQAFRIPQTSPEFYFLLGSLLWPR